MRSWCELGSVTQLDFDPGLSLVQTAFSLIFFLLLNLQGSYRFATYYGRPGNETESITTVIFKISGFSVSFNLEREIEVQHVSSSLRKAYTHLERNSRTLIIVSKQIRVLTSFSCSILHTLLTTWELRACKPNFIAVLSLLRLLKTNNLAKLCLTLIND